MIRSGAVSRMTGSSRTLGSSLAPMIQFQHVEVQQSDLIILTAADDVPWSDVALTSLSGVAIDQVNDRLVEGTDRDITGLVIQVPGNAMPRSVEDPPMEVAGTTAAAISAAPAASEPVAVPATSGEQTAQVQVTPASESGEAEPPEPDAVDFESETPRIWIRQLTFRLKVASRRARHILSGIIVRLIPGTLDAQQFDEFSPNLLAFTAAVVPILVVGISSIVYFKHGRVEQFESYLTQARSAVVTAQLQPLDEESRSEWVMAEQWLDLAESYQATDVSSSLRGEVQAALDQLDRVIRLEFIPAVSGGFGPKVNLTSVAATTTDLYTYDEGAETIWHAWATGRGYEIDSQFQCLAGADSIPDFGQPVSIVIQPEPGALGAEGVVAIDGAGSLLYCAPGAEPLTGKLATPDIGWGEIQAIEVFGNDLFVLDPSKNAVWIYNAADGPL